MQEVFRKAILPEEPDVLGVRLRPLSLGSVYILLAVDSPFAVGEPPNLGHLAFAVQICSRTFEDAKAWMRDANMLKAVESWGRAQRKTDFSAEREKFDAYLRDSISMPRRWSRNKGGGDPVRHPWPLVIAVSIMPLVGESRAWNMPIAEAISLWSAKAECDGDDSLMSDAEAATIEADLARQKAGDR